MSTVQPGIGNGRNDCLFNVADYSFGSNTMQFANNTFQITLTKP